jgi:hypothetical protein
MNKANDTQSLISVLMRPVVRDKSRSVTWGRNLLTTVFAAYQYSTAAAHADDYGQFPVSLLGSMSRNMVRELEELSRSLGESSSAAGHL